MLTPIAWQEVHEPPSVFLAIAGVSAKVLLVCAVESGWGVKAFLYANAATAEKAPTKMSAQMKMAKGQGRTKSLVGIQLN